MQRVVTTCFSMLILFAAAPGLCSAKEGDRVFRAGAATSNITPPLGELVVGGWAPFPATSIHDELHVRCLVLDDGEHQIGFAICDNVGIPREVFDLARKYIDDETDLPGANVLMSATHTHSATTARGPSKTAAEENLTWYQQFVARRIADGIRRALVNLEPARIGWGGVDEPDEVFNRRWHVTDPDMLKNPFGGVDTVRMNPPRGNAALVKPAGPIDPEVSFISVQATDGRQIALLANYSLHYVGGVGKGEVSADYFAIFSNRVGELLEGAKDNPQFVGMMTNGTSGDINNINFRDKSPKRYAPYEKMTEVAEHVAQKVAAAHKSIEFHDWVPVDMAHCELTLQVRKPDAQLSSYLEQVRARSDDQKYHTHEKIYADRIKRLVEGPDDVTILLQSARIGNLGIGAIPFEVFVEIGLGIKEKSPFDDAFTIELANGSYGYLPTPEQHKLGGYETWMGTNNVQLDASEKIADRILLLMQQLKERE
ncbi:MAG: hypothetical protein R3C18_11435 [Planctomycetaceae bacterium]